MGLFLERCPLTAGVHRLRGQRLVAAFPELATCSDGSYSALWKYLAAVPERFYCRESCDHMLSLLRTLMRNRPGDLERMLRERHGELSNGLQSLCEINSYPFHDSVQDSWEADFMRRLDQDFLPAYVKLTEGAYSNLILCLALWNRISRNVSIDGLDVYNRVEELSHTPFAGIAEPYDNTIRNAIAHGHVRFLRHDMVFTDRKREVAETYREFVARFDRMVDICNGLALGLSRFFFESREPLEGSGLRMPMPLLTEELKAQSSAPGWLIDTCLESEAAAGKQQLNIFVLNTCLDLRKVQYHAFRTAILAERFAPGFARYFLSLDSRYSRWRTGWAAFSGDVLRELRQQEGTEHDPSGYSKALEETGIMFIPIVRLPRLLHRLATIWASIRTASSVAVAELRQKAPGLKCDVRKVELHRNGSCSVVNGSVIVAQPNPALLEDAIRLNCRYVVKKAVRVARKHTSAFSIARYLPVGFAKLSVYSRDLRVRQLGVSGLVPELLATIEFKRLKRIRTVDILDGTSEVVSGCRIVWNKFRHSAVLVKEGR